MPGPSQRVIPIVCLIGAGKSVEELPIQEFRRVRPLADAKPLDRFYCARVSGSSLADDGIFDGDLVIVKASFEPHDIRPGRLVAILTPYGLLIKHIYISLNNKIRLVSANKEYEDIVLDPEECEIQGVVVRVERDM